MNENYSTDPFQGVLQDGESIVWRGQPDAEAYFNERMKKLYMIGVSLMVIGVAITGGFYVLFKALYRNPMPWWLILVFIGIHFIGALICIFVFPIAFRRDAKITHYALTTKRILCFRFSGLAAQPIERLPEITLQMCDEMEGIGNVRFGRFSKSPVSSECIAFDNISDVRKVCDMIEDARKKKMKGSR